MSDQDYERAVVEMDNLAVRPEGSLSPQEQARLDELTGLMEAAALNRYCFSVRYKEELLAEAFFSASPEQLKGFERVLAFLLAPPMLEMNIRCCEE